MTVTLTKEPLTEELLMLHYSVSDSGIGISEENIVRLTQPFFQVESSATRSYQGTGLGLAIVQRSVQRMGGTFSVSNESTGGLTALMKLRQVLST